MRTVQDFSISRKGRSSTLLGSSELPKALATEYSISIGTATELIASEQGRLNQCISKLSGHKKSG